jgi:hypothetical protein
MSASSRLPTALLLAAACATGRPPDAGEGAAWARARDAASRRGVIRGGFETGAVATALHLSLAVRERRAAQVAAWRAMTAPEREGLLAAERAAAAGGDEFLVAFFTPDGGDNDLDASQSVWRVALAVPEEGETLPAEVRAVRVDTEIRELYPFVGPHDLLYRLRFERREGAPLARLDFTLRIAGARGRLDLAFGP